MEKYKQKARKGVLIGFIVSVALLLGFLGSYAYFINSGNNNKKESMNVQTGNMALTFSDGSSNFQGSLNFGESATKTFTIENTGSIDAVARLKWDNLINTYLSGSLTYTLSYSETEDGEYTEIISNKNVPRSQQPAVRILANDLSIPVSKTYYYKLTITLNYLENIDQTADLNAIFSTNFILEDISSELAKNVMIARASYDSTDYFWEHSENIKKVVFENSLYPKENAAYTYDISEKKDGSVMSYLVPDTEDTSKYTLYIQANDYISANPDSSYLFYNFTNLENIEGLEYLDTINVTSMKRMFSDCMKLTSLNISNFDTSKITSTYQMFDGCNSLISLDLSNFNTSNVTDMAFMFRNCKSLTNLDISRFDTSKVTSMFYMFYGCNNLTSLDLSNFNTINVTNMCGMFDGCNNLISLNVSNFNTSNVTNMSYMFSGCNSLISLDVSSFDTSNVRDMSGMFKFCRNLVSLNVSNFNTNKVRNMYTMFWGCTNLISLDLSKFNTSNVTDMGSMFSGCKNLTSLDISNFDTNNVRVMSEMFQNCETLTNLDISNFDTDNVTNMRSMFSSCKKLSSLDLSNFNTNKVLNMDFMFSDCSNLTSLNVSNFDTSEIKSMSNTFSGCTNLTTTITIKGAKVTNNNGMFGGAATENGARIVVNYTNESSSLVDKMIATKSTNSNVVKGSLVNS